MSFRKVSISARYKAYMNPITNPLQELQPTNADRASWDFYFLRNPGRTAAGALALDKLGEAPVIIAQGELYYQRVLPSLKLELINGKRQGWDKELIMRNHGEKYVKQLKRFLKTNKITLPSQEKVAA